MPDFINNSGKSESKMKKTFKRAASIVLLLSIVLCFACTKQNQESKEEDTKLYLYKALENNNKNMPALLNSLPRDVEVYSDEIGLGYQYTEVSDILELIDAFSKITVGDRLANKEGVNESTGCVVFEWSDDDFCYLENYGNAIEIKDENNQSAFYEIFNSDEFYELVEKKLRLTFGLEKPYYPIAEHENLVVSVSDKYEIGKDGNYQLAVKAENNSSKPYELILDDLSVNGYGVHSYQFLSAAPETTVEYLVPIPTSVMHEYGIVNIGEIRFRINVYEGDNNSIGELVETSDYFTIRTSVYNPDMDTRIKNSVYSNNGITICLVEYDEDFSSVMDVFFSNSNDSDAIVSFDPITLNGNSLPIDGYKYIYTVRVKAGSGSFAYMPLYNFVRNEKSGENELIPVESLTLRATITQNGEKKYADIVVK